MGKKRLIAQVALAISMALLMILTHSNWALGVRQCPTPKSMGTSVTFLKPHPLPPTLLGWHDNTNSGDYFSEVTSTKVGYLVWSRFPIRIYVESPLDVSPTQAQAWVDGVLQAVQEWSAYLPLSVVDNQDTADVTILRKNPPLQISPETKIPRARSAQTIYELYTSNNVLLHRFTILLSKSQTSQYITAAARHELGHALGIWGHSPVQSDALYFSQVRNPSPISPRDVNTLKRIYKQPTCLGWNLLRPPT
jgi:predicted Zn-dependent protease